MEQPEIIYSIETMTENRKNVLEIVNQLKGKFLNGSFTINDLVKDCKYSSTNAKLVIDTLARNGLLNAVFSPNPNSIRYSFENDKQKQIENITLWLKRSEQELKFFSLAIQVIENELTEIQTTNLKSV